MLDGFSKLWLRDKRKITQGGTFPAAEPEHLVPGRRGRALEIGFRRRASNCTNSYCKIVYSGLEALKTENFRKLQNVVNIVGKLTFWDLALAGTWSLKIRTFDQYFKGNL